MAFSDIPLRENGIKILFGWFDVIRSAGVALEAKVTSFLGANVIAQTTATIANNQASAANVAGLLLDSTKGKVAHIYAHVRRKTDDGEKVAGGMLTALYRESTALWDVEPVDAISGDDDGVVFSIVAGTGQVQYASDNMAGANYAGSISFRAMYL